MSRNACGTMMPTKLMSPLTATAAAVPSVAAATTHTRVRATCAPSAASTSEGTSTIGQPPLPGSPAINAGLNSVTNSYTTDQRGFPRLVGAHVDIGAVEGVAMTSDKSPLLYFDGRFDALKGPG